VIRAAAVTFALLTALSASAQWPIIDPDDFLNPRTTGGRPVLLSRIVLGGASNMSGDGFRPLGKNVGYVHLATSLSWRSLQFAYKRSQMKAEDGDAAVWQFIRAQQPPTNVTPEAVGQFPPGVPFLQTRNATPKSKDTLNAGWYWPVGGGGGIPVMLRSRVTFATQPIETDTVIVSSDTNNLTQRISGRERTFALDTDTWFRIAGRDVFGSLAVSQTKTTGTLADRKERALMYTNRFPSLSLNRARIVIRPTFTVGAISNRGGSAVNLVNPAIEIFRPFARTGANLHVIYSPQWVASGQQSKATHQVAVLIDRALFVKVF
jgi:hypothetical protein